MSTSKPSKNAISHGAYSREVVLDWENEQEFKDLHEELREELFPNGRSEEEAVFDLTSLHWKKRRLNVGSQLLFRRIPDASALADAGRNGWDGIAEYLASSVQDVETVRESLRDVAKSYSEASALFCKRFHKQLELMDAPEVVPSGTPAPTGTPAPGGTSASGGTSPNATNQGSELSSDQVEKLILLAKEMRLTSREIAPALSMIGNYDLDERLCERAYRPEILERELKISADIDKRIEKTMVRLGWLKDYKKLYGAKEVKALPAQATTLPAKQPS